VSMLFFQLKTSKSVKFIVSWPQRVQQHVIIRITLGAKLGHTSFYLGTIPGRITGTIAIQDV
jgi:hypothetical protein